MCSNSNSWREKGEATGILPRQVTGAAGSPPNIDNYLGGPLKALAASSNRRPKDATPPNMLETKEPDPHFLATQFATQPLQ